MSPEQRAQVIAYLGDEWPVLRDTIPEEDHEAFLQAIFDSIGFKAWELTGTHDNPVSHTIRVYQERIVREVLAWRDTP